MARPKKIDTNNTDETMANDEPIVYGGDIGVEGVKELAKDIGASTAYDTLNSDIKYFYPSGCKSLDTVLGGGLPSGRFMELYGYESSGKSTVSLCLAKSFVDFWKSRGEGCIVLWIEAESVFDKVRAQYIGCDLNHFLIKEALCLEEAFETMRNFLKKGEEKHIHTMIVLDTVAALSPKSELEAGANSQGMMYKPRLLKSELSKLMPIIGRCDTPMIFVNQVYSGGMYEPAVSPGGGGLRFYPSIRAYISVAKKVEKLLPSGETMTVAIESKIVTKKNKVTLPNQTCTLHIEGVKGIIPFKTAIKFCENNKLIAQAGSWKKFVIKRKNANGELEELDMSYQNYDGLLKKLDQVGMTEKELMDYLDYLTVKYYADTSIFFKAKMIKEIWDYEEKLFGKKETTLSEEEQRIASLIYQREVLDVPDADVLDSKDIEEIS